MNKIKKNKKVSIYDYGNLVDDKFFRFLKIKKLTKISEIFKESSLVLIQIPVLIEKNK
jgi:hypothetical protein